MNPEKTTSKMIGALFLIVMITWGIGFGLIESVFSSQDYLVNVYPDKTKVIIGVFFEFLEIAAIIGIIALIFPLMKQYSESMAAGYAGFRILECTMLLVVAMSALFMITLSYKYLEGGTSNTDIFQILGAFLTNARSKWTSLAISVFYSLGAILFQIFLYKTRLVPRFISVWGLASAILVLMTTLAEALGIEWAGYIGISMGLNELFLGAWLLVKGFNASGVATLVESKP